MKSNLLIFVIWISALLTSNAAPIHFSTSKPVGSSISIAVDANVVIYLTWSNGKKDSLLSDGLPHSVKILSQDGILETDSPTTMLYFTESGLSHLDISAWSDHLERLYCGNNRLTSLDLSHQKSLRILDCSDNLLSEIDLKDCPSLASIDCRNNKLHTLPTTIGFSLQQLFCSGNCISHIRIADEIPLQRLWCGQKTLSTLETGNLNNLEQLISPHSELTDLHLKQAKSLQILNIEGNKLDTLSLETATKLSDVNISNNQLLRVYWNKNTKRYLKRLIAHHNSLTFKSLPRVYDSNNKKMIVEAYIHPQDSIWIADSIVTGDDLDLTDLLHKNAYEQLVYPKITLTDEKGNTLKRNNDYKVRAERLTFLKPFHNVSVTATSSAFPELKLNFKQFHVVESQPTGVVSTVHNSGLDIKIRKGHLTLSSDVNMNLVLFMLNGKPVAKLKVLTGIPTTLSLPAGVYLLNNNKIIIP